MAGEAADHDQRRRGIAQRRAAPPRDQAEARDGDDHRGEPAVPKTARHHADSASSERWLPSKSGTSFTIAAIANIGIESSAI